MPHSEPRRPRPPYLRLVVPRPPPTPPARPPAAFPSMPPGHPVWFELDREVWELLHQDGNPARGAPYARRVC